MPPFLNYQHPILTYHHIGAPEGDPTVTLSGKAFARQMSLLKTEKRSLRLEELVSSLKSKSRPLPRKVAVTFDDGYQDFYTHAYPCLQECRIPATVFLVTAWIGKRGFLSWEMVREMSQKGVDFGSHTQNHPYLPEVTSRERLEEEIRGSKEILEDRLGKEVSLFSYPVGGFTEEVKEMVRKSGYMGAVTTNRGVPGKARDPYALSRIKMTESSTPSWIFRVKTSGYYEQFKRRKRPY